ncbi:phage tail protein [Pseudorhodoferax sp. LjRoot39]|uniref:phage tail protein n=1 Tax=Pseudorhodoferax sp. LjRoot39 TaxID=3342328 RepID=UPI003ED00657
MITPQALQAGRAQLRSATGANYPPPAFHFTVSFGAQPSRDADSAFHEVSGIAPEIETETVAEGGLNGSVHVLPKGVKQPRLVLKRGIALKTSRLVGWCQDVLNGDLIKPIVPQLMHVFLLDHQGEPLRGWSIENAWPVKWEIDSFNATRNQVAMEKIELAYARSNRIR